MFKLIDKTTNEVVRLSDDRIFYDTEKYDLIEYDTIDKRRLALTAINNATTLADIKVILKQLIKEII